MRFQKFKDKQIEMDKLRQVNDSSPKKAEHSLHKVHQNVLNKGI